ncbi:MAG: hypothetical protein QM800_09020 [Paludibacter sp.]
MNFIAKEKKYWWLLPLLFTLLIIVLLYSKNISFDLIHFKKEKKLLHDIFILFVVLTPLLLLRFFDNWKQSDYKKILSTGIASLLISFNFSTHLFFQISSFFAITTIVYFIIEKKVYRPNLFQILLFVYFGICTSSLLWTSNVTLGLKYLRSLTPLVYIPLLFCFFNLSRRDFEMIALFLFRFSIIFAFITICSWIVESRFLNFPLENSLIAKKYSINIYNSYDVVYAWSNQIHPTYNAISLLFSLSVGWYFIFKRNVKDGISYFELIFVIFTTLLIVVISASRFMFVEWVFVNTAGFLYSVRKKRNLFIISTSSVIILGISLLFSFSAKVDSFINDPVRDCHYNAAFQSIKENPLLGTGLGGMTKYINIKNSVYAPLNLQSNAEFPHIHPHNQIIGDLMQTGVMGLITILLILGVLFFYSIKYRNWLLLINTITFLMLMNIEMPLMYLAGIFSFGVILNFLLKKESNSKVLLDFNKNRIEA